ncbi:MAG: hypothetical protein HFJ49_01370 [Clostridia bacterium]|nr:hypothetical protein [Clostridia bacterium]
MELLEKTNSLTTELFTDTEKMKDFLCTISKMYNMSYSNILLLKSKRKDISFVANKETIQKYKYHIKPNQEPIKIIRRMKIDNIVKFKVEEVYDISQTDAKPKKNKVYSKEYIEKVLKGMCSRRGLVFQNNHLIDNLENIVINISSNCRINNSSIYNIDRYARQTQIETDATIFAIANRLNIDVKDNIKDICKWGIDKDLSTLKDSLRYIQKFTNYFINDFQMQERLCHIEQEELE